MCLKAAKTVNLKCSHHNKNKKMVIMWVKDVVTNHFEAIISQYKTDTIIQ